MGFFTLFCFTPASPGSFTREVDLFNSKTLKWTTARLSVARYTLAAASVGSIALFAGGETIVLRACFSPKTTRGARILVFAWLIPMQLFASARIVVTLSLSLSRRPQVLREAAFPMQSICTTLPLGHGRQRSSVWHAVTLHPRVLETWPSLRGVQYPVC